VWYRTEVTGTETDEVMRVLLSLDHDDKLEIIVSASRSVLSVLATALLKWQASTQYEPIPLQTVL